MWVYIFHNHVTVERGVALSISENVFRLFHVPSLLYSILEVLRSSKTDFFFQKDNISQATMS